MQVSNVKQQGEISKADLLQIAPFSKRQLARMYRAGYLPLPQRRPRSGGKEPVYFWDESVVERATLLYDLLQLRRSDDQARLALWLRGYQVDFAPIRRRWLDSIGAYLQAFTQGELDDPLDNINNVVEEMKKKWGHIPTQYRPEPFRRLGLEDYAQWTEYFWAALLVPELSEAMFAEVFAVLQMIGAAEGDTQPPDEFAESWLRMLQEVLAMPQLREAIEQATPEAWEQARLDYETLCQFCRTFFAPATQTHPKWVNLLQFVVGGFYLVPVALAIRYWEYDQWIDDAVAWANEFLNDPNLQAWLAQRRAESQSDNAGG